jgi:hypothetical protein
MITKDFLEGEIQQLESEVKKAQAFTLQAQAVINAYRMLVSRLDEEPLGEENADAAGPKEL